jgi:hypothetical protein
MMSSASWRTVRSSARVIGEGGLEPCCPIELPTGDPGAEKGSGNKRLSRLVVLGTLFLSLSLSLTEERLRRFEVCFMVLRL